MNRRNWASFALMALLVFVAINLLTFRPPTNGHRYYSIGFSEWLKLRHNYITPTGATISWTRLVAEIAFALCVAGAWGYWARTRGHVNEGRKVTKLGLQSARVGESVVVSTEGRDAYRYEDGERFVRIPTETIYDDGISDEEIRRRLRSWFGAGKLVQHMVNRIYLSEVKVWEGSAAGVEITEGEKAKIRQNLELALTALGSRVEFA